APAVRAAPRRPSHRQTRAARFVHRWRSRIAGTCAPSTAGQRGLVFVPDVANRDCRGGERGGRHRRAKCRCSDSGTGAATDLRTLLPGRPGEAYSRNRHGTRHRPANRRCTRGHLDGLELGRHGNNIHSVAATWRTIGMSAGRILVVDDDPQIRRVMRVTLTGHGYEVDDVKSGEAALEKIRDQRFDLVLLDMNMAGMGGLDTCRAIRGQSEVAIIMLTVRDTETDKVEALDAGADDYVTKPFKPPELLARTRAALRRTPGTPGARGS